MGKSRLGNLEIFEVFLCGGPNLNMFEIKHFQHICTTKMGFALKFESKRSKSLDFRAYFVFKDLTKKIILCATPHPKMAINLERNRLQA